MDQLPLALREHHHPDIMSEQWYIKGEGDEKIGPYTAEQIQRYALVGSLAPEDLVWTERVESWIPASSVEGLFPIVQREAHAPGITSPSPTPSTVLHPGYQTTARALWLIRLGSLLGFLAVVLQVFISLIGPKLSPDTLPFIGYLSASLVGGGILFFLVRLIGYSMGFGAPRDGAARALLGVALAIQLLPLITAVIGASAILTLAMNDNLEFLVGFLSFGGALWALAFFFALIILQPIAGMINLALMGGYLKRVSLSLGLPAADAISLMRRVWWKFGFLGFTVANLLLEPVINLGINYLLALLGGLAFCLQYLVAYFHYLGLLSSTRSSILFQKNRGIQR